MDRQCIWCNRITALDGQICFDCSKLCDALGGEDNVRHLFKLILKSEHPLWVEARQQLAAEAR